MKKKFWSLFTKKYIYINIVAAIAVVVFLVWMVFQALNSYTRHGEFVVLPDFRGISIDSLEKYAAQEDFRTTVLDSVFDLKLEPGSVYIQNPVAGSKVKKGRMIYTTIIATISEKTELPNLDDLSLRQAIKELEAVKLFVKNIEIVQGFDNNAVQAVRLDTAVLAAGDTLVINSQLTLVASRKNPEGSIRIPLLFGMTPKQARIAIHQAAFNHGTFYYPEGDSLLQESALRVYKQVPLWSHYANAKPGSSIELYFCKLEDQPFDSIRLVLQQRPTIQDSIVDGFIINQE